MKKTIFKRDKIATIKSNIVLSFCLLIESAVFQPIQCITNCLRNLRSKKSIYKSRDKIVYKPQ